MNKNRYDIEVSESPVTYTSWFRVESCFDYEEALSLLKKIKADPFILTLDEPKFRIVEVKSTVIKEE